MSIIDSISNFRVLSSSNASRTELVKRYCRKIDEILDLMKMVLDGAFSHIIPDDKLNKVLEELNATINEASELVGGWNQMTSKIYFVIPLSFPFMTSLCISQNIYNAFSNSVYNMSKLLHAGYAG